MTRRWSLPFKRALKTPRRLMEMNDGQREAFIAELTKLSLPELRRRQNLVLAQIPRAHCSRNSIGLENLQVLDQLLISAILEKV